MRKEMTCDFPEIEIKPKMELVMPKKIKKPKAKKDVSNKKQTDNDTIMAQLEYENIELVQQIERLKTENIAMTDYSTKVKGELEEAQELIKCKDEEIIRLTDKNDIMKKCFDDIKDTYNDIISNTNQEIHKAKNGHICSYGHRFGDDCNKFDDCLNCRRKDACDKDYRKNNEAPF